MIRENAGTEQNPLEIMRAELEQEKLIVIVRGIKGEDLIPLAAAMYKGGIRFLEITYSADGSVTDEETADNIKRLKDAFEGKMYIGAGTVLTEKQAELTKQAGGRFVISPDTNTEVIRKTKELGMLSIPGALTPTEVQLAHRSGADFVKLFPVTKLGVEYVKAIRAPFSQVRLLAVGGINEENMTEYFKAGICGFGIGSHIVSKKLVESKAYAEITALAEKYVSVVKTWRTT